MSLSYEYAKNRFLNPQKIIDASIYEKQATTANDKGEYPKVIRVAISMDTENKDKATLYSDAMPTMEAARAYAVGLPTQS